jgi:hypothetical protein
MGSVHDLLRERMQIRGAGAQREEREREDQDGED